ncbi:MAG: SurA N-terminal domain-containing protein [Caulobacteraceae bacterium]
MMAAFRALVKSWVAKVLLGLLVISFGVWGVRDVFHTRISDWVIKAGSRTVTATEFKQVFDRQLRQASQQTGRALTAQDAADAGLDTKLLQDMADSEAIAELIRRSGIQASDKLLVSELRKQPAFFNSITGAFDEKAYQALLAQNQLTPTEYEKGLRDEIAQDHFSIGMVAGLRAPRTYSALIAMFNLQARAFSFFAIDPKSVGAPPKPTDADLTKFMQDNADRLRRPETRQISLVRFSAQALAPTPEGRPGRGAEAVRRQQGAAHGAREALVRAGPGQGPSPGRRDRRAPEQGRGLCRRGALAGRQADRLRRHPAERRGRPGRRPGRLRPQGGPGQRPDPRPARPGRGQARQDHPRQARDHRGRAAGDREDDPGRAGAGQGL